MRVVIGIAMIALVGTLAYKKGLQPLAWLLAAGPIGFIVLFFLPSAKEEGLDRAARASRVRLGNTVGWVMSGLVVLGSIVLFAVR
ncbi:hypothetical protein SAMN04244553_4633 [Nocardia amikacinitolerans]|uniref:Uncharacterized protein n=1 Tax=Nocardia amikacinitolerans TaxID=756689 RepID=A0A285LTB0_9NOCA|nr:hypothetical protein [Nocardia amikacinitolerans]MCP2276365.1 hypothetical protein [Nocardia amikacinitolerans]MCP2295256.1 hypothetical protein [Nocardia amikacinitolerans]SNY87683.1 hypothetical protein SAMN04244553_4633 [Nocardia amikacinitolerans]